MRISAARRLVPSRRRGSARSPFRSRCRYATITSVSSAAATADGIRPDVRDERARLGAVAASTRSPDRRNTDSPRPRARPRSPPAPSSTVARSTFARERHDLAPARTAPRRTAAPSSCASVASPAAPVCIGDRVGRRCRSHVDRRANDSSDSSSGLLVDRARSATTARSSGVVRLAMISTTAPPARRRSRAAS